MVWGPSGNTLLEDDELQSEIKAMIGEGIDVLACKACADRYGISDGLSELGVNVLFTGELLTNATKSPEWAVLAC